MRLPKCLGIPVVFDERSQNLSDVRGIWPWRWIFVGPQWVSLTDRGKGAVLLHEVGHCKLFHAEKMVLRMALSPRFFYALIRASRNTARAFPDEKNTAFDEERARGRSWLMAWLHSLINYNPPSHIKAHFDLEVNRLCPWVSAYRCEQEFAADAFAAGCGYGPELAQVLARVQSAEGHFHPPVRLRIERLCRQGERHGIERAVSARG